VHIQAKNRSFGTPLTSAAAAVVFSTDLDWRDTTATCKPSKKLNSSTCK